MLRFIFIVEGETEEEFVNNVLCPHFGESYNFWAISCYKIKTTRGGLTKYSYLKKDVLRAVHEAGAYVTTLIDFYQLPQDMPDYKKAQQTKHSDRAIAILTQGMKADINAPNFLPYLQKHEFEALLFSDPSAFDEYEEDHRIAQKVASIVQQFGDQPEDINNAPETAPSKRLIQLYQAVNSNYNKVLMGALLAEAIGLPTIRQKCPHFNAWLTQLETIIEQAHP